MCYGLQCQFENAQGGCMASWWQRCPRDVEEEIEEEEEEDDEQN